MEETLAERSKSYRYVQPFTFDLGPRGTQRQGLEVTGGGSDLGLNSGLDTKGSYFIRGSAFLSVKGGSNPHPSVTPYGRNGATSVKWRENSRRSINACGSPPFLEATVAVLELWGASESLGRHLGLGDTFARPLEFPVRQTLLVWEPHFETHWFRSPLSVAGRPGRR